MRQEVCCPRRLADPTSLVDWRCSCLCFELIPSVTERSVLLVKEMSFPQTAPTDDAFFNRTGMECIGVIGLDLDCCWASLQALDRRAGDRSAAGLVCRLWVWHSSTKTRKKVGRQGLRPWPLRCLSQFLTERKDRLLRGRMLLRTFH